MPRNQKGQSNRKKRDRTISLHGKNEVLQRAWAITVDKFFAGCKDTKDRDFKTLTSDEETQFIEKYRENRPILEYFLIKHHIFLALNIASKYSMYGKDYENLLSSAMYGLAMAAKKFDISKKIKFSTYAVWWIRKYVLEEVSGDRYKKTITDNTDIYLDASDMRRERNDENTNYNTFTKSIEPTYSYMMKGTTSPYDAMDDITSIESASALLDKISKSVSASSLSDSDKKVYSKMFVDGKTPNDISAEMGITKHVIARSKMRIASYISETFPELKKRFDEQRL